MKILIIKVYIAYSISVLIMAATLFLNPYLKMGRVNLKTGEFEPASDFFKAVFSFLWFITIPMYLLQRNSQKED